MKLILILLLLIVVLVVGFSIAAAVIAWLATEVALYCGLRRRFCCGSSDDG